MKKLITTYIFIVAALAALLTQSSEVRAADIPDILYASSISTDQSVPYDLRVGAGILGEKYHILEGGCTDGTYAYFSMWNDKEDSCKIIKVRLNDGRAPTLIKVSAPLKINHGNDITYNADRRKLIIVHCLIKGARTKEISELDPDSLTVTSTKDVVIPDNLPGATKKQIKAIGGFDGISYNAKKNQYIVLLSKETGDFLLLDKDYEAVQYYDVKTRFNYVNQGIDSTDNYIIVSKSQNVSGNHNGYLIFYKWDDGSYVKKILLKGMRYEIENVFHTGQTWYASCYAHDKDTSQIRFGYLYTIGEKIAVTGVKLNKSSITLKPMDTAVLSATVEPKEAENKAVTWSSSDPSVASVSPDGTVTAIKTGKTVILVRTRQSHYVARCTVKVEIPGLKTPSSLKAARKGKRNIKVTWKKTGSPDGYEIQVSRDSSFADSYTVRVGKKAKSRLFKNLVLRKHKYYIRMRAYKKVNGAVYYSSYTSVKTARTK